MKIKLDENLPKELLDLLTAARHDVHTVLGEGLAGAQDSEIFAAAVAEDRLFITQDMDFSDVRRFKPGSHPGLILVRLRDPARRRLIERFRDVLAAHPLDDWAGCFVIVSDRKLRVRRP